MTTGERIKKRREELGLTQLALALRMGYKSRAAICNVEKDKEDLTTARIRKFADALDTTPAYLMGWEDAANELPHQTKALNDKLNVLSYTISDEEYKKVLEMYRQIELLPEDKKQALQNYLRFLQSDV